MHRLQLAQGRLRKTIALLMCLCTPSIIVSCATSDQKGDVAVPAIVTGTSVQGTSTATIDPKDAAETALAVTRSAMFTRSALTGTVPNPGPPSPQATYPPGIGIFWAD